MCVFSFGERNLRFEGDLVHSRLNGDSLHGCVVKTVLAVLTLHVLFFRECRFYDSFPSILGPTSPTDSSMRQTSRMEPCRTGRFGAPPPRWLPPGTGLKRFWAHRGGDTVPFPRPKFIVELLRGLAGHLWNCRRCDLPLLGVEKVGRPSSGSVEEGGLLPRHRPGEREASLSQPISPSSGDSSLVLSPDSLPGSCATPLDRDSADDSRTKRSSLLRGCWMSDSSSCNEGEESSRADELEPPLENAYFTFFIRTDCRLFFAELFRLGILGVPAQDASDRHAWNRSSLFRYSNSYVRTHSSSISSNQTRDFPLHKLARAFCMISRAMPCPNPKSRISIWSRLRAVMVVIPSMVEKYEVSL